MPYSDPEKRKQKCIEYRQRNLERLREYDRLRNHNPARIEAHRRCGKSYRDKYKDKIAVKNSAWAKKNPERRRAAVRRYRERHPERVKEMGAKTRKKYAAQNAVRSKSYRAANPEKVKKWEAARMLRRKANPELLARKRQEYRDYYERNKEMCKRKVTAYAKINSARVRMWSRISNARRRGRLKSSGGICTRIQWLARCEFYGWKCAYCLTSLTLETVEMEHVKPVHLGGSNWPANLVPACGGCNMRKHIKRILPTWISHHAK